MSVAPAGSPRPALRSLRRPRLRVLGRPRHTRRFVLAALVIAAAGIFGIVSLNALAAEASFRARELEREVTELSLRYDELTAEVAALSAPSRVRQVAVEELGMVPAPNPGFLFTEATPGSTRVVGFDPGAFSHPRGGAHALHGLAHPPDDAGLASPEAVKQALGEG